MNLFVILSILGFLDLTGGHEVPPEEEQAQILTSCRSPGNQLTASFPLTRPNSALA